MHIFGVQLDTAWEDKTANFIRVGQLLDQADIPSGSLIALPEMFSTGFSMNVAGIHEGQARPAEAFLCEIARQYESTVIGGVVTWADGKAESTGSAGRGRNEALVVDPSGTAIARYAKLHPFGFAGETEHYQAGDEVTIFDWQGLRVAPTICYDLRFPEAYRQAVARGAQVLVIVANFPAAREDHWLSLAAARAIENQAYIVAVNRCGEDPNATYGGRSRIIDPRGNILAEAGDSEAIVSAKIDPDAQAAYRANFPALADMRPDLIH